MLKLLKNLKPFTVQIILIFFLIFGRALSELFLPTLMSDIVDVGILKGDTPYILKIGGIMMLVAIGGALVSVLASYLSAKTATSFSRNIRGKVFRRVESFSLHEFDELGTASIITRTTNDITQVYDVENDDLRPDDGYWWHYHGYFQRSAFVRDSHSRHSGDLYTYIYHCQSRIPSFQGYSKEDRPVEHGSA
jgi:ABC-type multidrug transport system fused ATPase/permease subunit